MRKSKSQIIAKYLIISIAFGLICSIANCKKQIRDKKETYVEINLSSPYKNLTKFPDEDFEVEFRVMFDSLSKSKWRDVKFYFRENNSDNFTKVNFGEVGKGIVKPLYNTLYDYSVRIPRKKLKGGTIYFYVEAVDYNGDAIRYPKKESYLVCKEYREKYERRAPFGMVYISGGEFQTGGTSNNNSSRKKIDHKRDNKNDHSDQAVDQEKVNKWEESPKQKIHVNPFYIDQFEITNEQYKIFCDKTMNEAPLHWDKDISGIFSVCPPGKERYPVCNISFDSAKKYCEWVGKRLPTEAEWEFAAKGKTGNSYPWGDKKIPNMANFLTDDNYYGLAPVKSFARSSSKYGCINMLGNVAEYVDAPIITPAENYSKVWKKRTVLIKGGSYCDVYNVIKNCSRQKVAANVTYRGAGFRCAKDTEDRDDHKPFKTKTIEYKEKRQSSERNKTIKTKIRYSDRELWIQHFNNIAKILSNKKYETGYDSFNKTLCAFSPKNNGIDVGAMPDLWEKLCKLLRTKDWQQTLYRKSYDWLHYFFAKNIALKYGDFRSAYELSQKIDTETWFDKDSRFVLDKIIESGHMIRSIYENAPAAQTEMQNKILYQLIHARYIKGGINKKVIIAAGNGKQFMAYEVGSYERKKTINVFIANQEDFSGLKPRVAALNRYENKIDQYYEKKKKGIISKRNLKEMYPQKYDILYKKVKQYYTKNEFDQIMSSNMAVELDKKQIEKIRYLASPRSIKAQTRIHTERIPEIVKEKKLREGVIFFNNHKEQLIHTYQKTGVEPCDIISILKWESNFGKNQGRYLVFKTLNAQYFYLDQIEEELYEEGVYNKKDIIDRKDALKRIEKLQNRALFNLHHLMIQAKIKGFDLFNVKGSWAGAIGIPQFMPASMVYASDGDDDGFVNLNTMPDAIMSIAYYLVKHKYHQKNKRHAFREYNPNDAYVEGVYLYSREIEKRGVKP